jgi:uncharacterized lipoprotein
MENSGISMKTKILLILFPALVAGCGMTHGERTDYQNEAAKVAALEVPPDLVPPKTNDHYTIPAGGGTETESYSQYAKGNAGQNSSCTCNDKAAAPAGSAQPKAPQVAAAATVPPSLRKLPGGGKGIVINEPFDRCWLDVGLALDSAGIAVDDKDRSKGLFYLKGGNQVTVRTDEAGCEVAASNASGAVSSETNDVIDALYKGLGK